jgi:NitT/TauT family transport system substrate-binding protein
MVRSAGLDPQTDVTLLDLAVGMQVPAVVGGSIDATLSLEPVGSIAEASGQARRAMTNPVAMYIADPFYSGVSLLTGKFLSERPQVAKRVVEALDEATRMANAGFEKYKSVIPKYTPIREQQLALLAQPYLRGFSELNDTDLNSYQALVDVFLREGVLAQKVNVRDHILQASALPK